MTSYAVPYADNCKASAGYLADGRHISNRARDEASSFRENYRAPATLQVRSAMPDNVNSATDCLSDSTL